MHSCLRKLAIAFARTASEGLPLEIHGEAPKLGVFGAKWVKRILGECCDPKRIMRLGSCVVCCIARFARMSRFGCVCVNEKKQASKQESKQLYKKGDKSPYWGRVWGNPPTIPFCMWGRSQVVVNCTKFGRDRLDSFFGRDPYCRAFSFGYILTSELVVYRIMIPIEVWM